MNNMPEPLPGQSCPVAERAEFRSLQAGQSWRELADPGCSFISDFQAEVNICMRPLEMKKALCGSKLEFVPWLPTSSHEDGHPQGLSLLPHRSVGQPSLPPADPGTASHIASSWGQRAGGQGHGAGRALPLGSVDCSCNRVSPVGARPQGHFRQREQRMQRLTGERAWCSGKAGVPKL